MNKQLGVKVEGVEATLLMSLKKFSTGSIGYHYGGQVTIGGVPYQANLMVIEQGSSPETKNAETRAAFLLRQKEREKATK